MKHCLRFLVLLLALWLPLQTALASVLPSCPVAGAMEAERHDDAPSPDVHEGDAACTDCAICHLSCTWAPPLAGSARHHVTHAAVQAAAHAALLGFTPPIPDRPPLPRTS
ncbi:MAG TPA: hypothetical protein VIS77_00810 [Burkholderiales bacterium]